MKAIVRETYGPPDVLHLDDVPLPTVGDGDVLVRGTDVAGHVEAVGRNITRFRPCDKTASSFGALADARHRAFSYAMAVVFKCP